MCCSMGGWLVASPAACVLRLCCPALTDAELAVGGHGQKMGPCGGPPIGLGGGEGVMRGGGVGASGWLPRSCVMAHVLACLFSFGDSFVVLASLIVVWSRFFSPLAFPSS
jgi:hypothetical protein